MVVCVRRARLGLAVVKVAGNPPGSSYFRCRPDGRHISERCGVFGGKRGFIGELVLEDRGNGILVVRYSTSIVLVRELRAAALTY